MAQSEEDPTLEHLDDGTRFLMIKVDSDDELEIPSDQGFSELEMYGIAMKLYSRYLLAPLMAEEDEVEVSDEDEDDE